MRDLSHLSLPLLTGLASVITGATLYFYSRRKSVATPPSTTHPVDANTIVPANQDGTLKVLLPEQLYAVTGTLPLINQILQRCRASREDMEMLYWPAINRIASMTQLLPASESHHHAQPGGLLTHLLEVCAFAMAERQGKLLPVGAATEDRPRLEHRWTYGVFLGSLLHDIGKPLTDLKILFSKDKDGNEQLWNPLSGSLVELKAIHYRIEFPEQAHRDYSAHQRMSVVLLNTIAPQKGLAWLADDPMLMNELLSCLSGDDKHLGAIHELVMNGDRESVSKNLLNGSRTRFAVAKRTPLIERLMDALRNMLSERLLPLNRDGAAGWVKDDAIWFVSKRLADSLRDFETNKDWTGIPGKDKNLRIFDTLQEYGALEPNPDTGGAIWYVVVKTPTYQHELSVLKFPLNKLYQIEQDYPAQFEGDIRILRKAIPVDQSNQSGDDTPPAAITESPLKTPEQSDPESVAVESSTSTSLSNNGEPTKSKVTQIAKPTIASKAMAKKVIAGQDIESEKSTQAVTAIAPVLVADKESIKNDQFLDTEDTAKAAKKAALEAVRPALPKGSRKPKSAADSGPTEGAILFIKWLQNGLATGELSYNDDKALVHFTGEGALLVSPKIFRFYVEKVGLENIGISIKGEEIAWERVQKHLTMAGWNQVGPDNNNVVSYRVVRSNDKEGGTILRGILLVDAERFFSPLPPANQMLSLVDVSNKPHDTGSVVSPQINPVNKKSAA